MFNTGRVASMLSSACNRGSHSQEICKGCGTSFRRRGVTDEKTSRGGFRCGPSPASCQWVSRTEARGAGKGRGRDSKSTNAGQSPEPSRNERRCFNEVVKDLPLVFLNPTVVAAPDNRMAATGCLTLESAGAATEPEWELICLASAYEHWSDAFDGPHDTGTTGRNRLALRNRESAGVERAGTLSTWRRFLRAQRSK